MARITPDKYIWSDEGIGGSTSSTAPTPSRTISTISAAITTPPLDASRMRIEYKITNTAATITLSGGGTASLSASQTNGVCLLARGENTQITHYASALGSIDQATAVFTALWDENSNALKFEYAEESSTNIIDSESVVNIQLHSYVAEGNISSQSEYYTSYQFKDSQQVKYEQLTAVTDNTQLRPQLITIASNIDPKTLFGHAFELSAYYHTPIKSDNLQLYKIQHNKKIEQYNCSLEWTTVPAYLLATPCPSGNYDSIDFVGNPNLYLLYSIAHEVLQDNSKYYDYLTQHDECWQTLYRKYPGIFRESNYENSTAVNSQELYQAAKAQLDSVCKPSYEYSLTGMDIYMHDSDYIPTRIKLGEQIRIDYQEKDQLTDTLNAAIREPLYVTGISHTLRNDGDYQFTVTTRTATDIMVQRFAQLLNFGK